MLKMKSYIIIRPNKYSAQPMSPRGDKRLSSEGDGETNMNICSSTIMV